MGVSSPLRGPRTSRARLHCRESQGGGRLGAAEVLVVRAASLRVIQRLERLAQLCRLVSVLRDMLSSKTLTR